MKFIITLLLISTLTTSFLVYRILQEIDMYTHGFDCIERKDSNFMVNKCIEVPLTVAKYSSLVECQKSCHGSRKISLGLDYSAYPYAYRRKS